MESNQSTPTLLYLSVSPNDENVSYSRRLGTCFLQEFQQKYPQSRIVHRNLSEQPEPHLTETMIFASYLPEQERTEEMQAFHQHRVELIQELLAADVIVLATPKWNWNVPSVVKAYIDQVIVVGLLDPYTQKHLTGKSVSILVAMGGGDRPKEPFIEHLVQLFQNLGATDVQSIQTEFCLAGKLPNTERLLSKRDQSFENALNKVKERVTSLSF